MSKTAAILVAVLLTGAPGFAQSLAPPTVAPTVRDVPVPRATAPGTDLLPTFGSLFRDLGRDFRRLPSRESAVIAGVSGALSLAVRHEDVDLTRRAVGSPSLDTMFESGAALGSGLAQFGGAFATFVLGRATGNARIALVGADLFRAQIVNTALTQTIKFSVDRDRPDGGRYSFPSGHASGTFAAATVLQRHFGWRAGLPAYAVAAYVAGSRLQENKHYMSDVIFGAGVGIIAGRAVTVGHGRAHFALAPFAAPGGGGGVGFTLVDPHRPS